MYPATLGRKQLAPLALVAEPLAATHARAPRPVHTKSKALTGAEAHMLVSAKLPASEKLFVPAMVKAPAEAQAHMLVSAVSMERCTPRSGCGRRLHERGPCVIIVKRGARRASSSRQREQANPCRFLRAQAGKKSKQRTRAASCVWPCCCSSTSRRFPQLPCPRGMRPRSAGAFSERG